MPPRRRRFLAALVAFGVIALTVAAVRQNDPPRHAFRVVFGLKDKEPGDWSGQLTVAGGEVAALDGWRFEGKEDSVQGTTAWKCRTRNGIAPEQRYAIQGPDGAPKHKAGEVPWPNGIHLTVQGAAPTVTLKLARGNVKFSASDVPLGEPRTFLDGQVRVERIPTVSVPRPAAPPKAAKPVQDDYPAFWVRYRTGKHYLAWVAYQNERDRVLLVERDGPDGKWSEPVEVAGPGQHFRVALATLHDDTLWIVWASQRGGNWDLFARPYLDGKLGAEVRLTEDVGPDLWHRMTTDNRGRAWLVWQGFRGGRSVIFARCADMKGWHEPVQVSSDRGNAWDPTVAADSKEDRVWVGWDAYERDTYNVRVRALSGGPKPNLGGVLFPEPSPLFAAHVSLACDREGRLWAAWDESGPQWGKDTGFLYGGQHRADTTRLYASRTLRVKCLADGKWQEPAADLYSTLPADMKEYNDYPQLQGDSDGRMWLAFRHRTCRRPREDGWAAQGRWDLYVTAYLGDRWLAPVEVPGSGGRNDMRTSSQRDRDGAVYFAHASDNRGWLLAMPPRNLNVSVSRFAGAPKPGGMRLVEKKRDYPIAAPCHPREAEQVARIRNYKVQVGGRTYRIYRGDLHRHTDISGDGPGDGTLMDLHRYALDAAAMDFVLVGDHNMGNDNEYSWWRTQQANDLYTVPGAFISMYGYERSVKYPGGHRNVIWTERGHRTLPLPAKPLPAVLANDTAKLYDYLRKTNGICTLHTSASDQGTDWAAAHDPKLEPFVEIFQGFHTSYEAPGAPRAIDAKTDRIHGPFKADGFVSLALNKGYRLGFQASSDHISTHVSYACVLAEEFTRKGLVEAMRKRHSYAATDNIVLDVRMGNHLMGDEVRTAQPKLDVAVLGTNLLEKVEVLRDGAVVHTQRPAAPSAEARFAWQDPAPRRGEKASYYYVRVTQQDGQMAWASPLWVTVGN
ncbi:MAG: DUF3604 domain-containing protein [Gemmataceae bacterium]|nr:DUF3604 domain-containing protein [Gemmataceae bacterium]